MISQMLIRLQLVVGIIVSHDFLFQPNHMVLIEAFKGSANINLLLNRFRCQTFGSYQPLPYETSRRAKIDVKDGKATSEGQHNTRQPMELWLDLRDTLISPRAALLYLLTELQSSSTNGEDVFELPSVQVNRVLISNFNQQEYDKQWSPSIHELITNGLILVTDDQSLSDHWTVLHVSSSLDQQQLFAGELVKMRDATRLVNPIPIMMCLESGGWVILDSSDIQDDRDRMHAVSSVVNLLSGLPSSSISNVGSNVNSKNSSTCDGGVALICSNNQDIYNFVPLIESLRCRGDTSVSTNDCGILISSSFQKENDLSSYRIKRTTALVLPFDPVLWKTMSLFL